MADKWGERMALAIMLAVLGYVGLETVHGALRMIAAVR